MMKRVLKFLLLLGVWLLLAWPFKTVSGTWHVELPELALGVLVVLLTMLVMRDTVPSDFPFRFSVMRIFWFVAYLFVLVTSIVRANFDVAYRVLHPAMPIHPGIVKVKCSLKTPSAVTLLANSITLTPGTLTVHASTDGILYVHWINVTSTDVDEASRRIVGRYEWFIRRIFE